MPRGSRTVTLLYPGRFRIPEHSGFIVRIGDNIGSILIFHHLQPVEALDVANGLQSEAQEGRTHWRLQRPIVMADQHNMAMVSEGQLLYVFEDGVQYYRVFRSREYTELFIVHDVVDAANISQEEHERYEKILDRFLTAYRAFAGDVSVRLPNDLIEDYPVVRAGIHEYTEEELRIPEPERITTLRDLGIRVEAVPLGANPHTLRPPTVDPERVCPLIQHFLANEASMSEPQVMLTKALEELKIGQDYRYALLLAFFSIEQVLTEFLDDIKGRAGVPEGTIESFRGEIGMSYKINVELPLVLRPDAPARQLLTVLDRANGLRNRVVHKGHAATFEQAGFMINVGDQLIKGLSGQPVNVPAVPAGAGRGR